MLVSLEALYALASKWLNNNQGVVGVIIFLVTIIFGWVSGIFSALRRKPKFQISIIDGPTYCCTYPTGRRMNDFDVHRTGFALYLSISNIGSAPSSIKSVSIGYHWSLLPFSIQWLKHSVGWFWLHSQSASLEDFHTKIGENIKVYPFLIQINALSSARPQTYLEVGQATNGVVYFEQSDSWGGCMPRVESGTIKVRVCVNDVFGNRHVKSFRIPSVSLKDARKYNPSFGKTLAELHGEPLPHDESI